MSFLCAAVFVFVLERYGLVQACLAGAAIFFGLTLIAAASYLARKKEVGRDAEPRSGVQTALADPMLVAAGLQVVRAVGLKRLIPILALGGVALGLLASRSSADRTPAE